MTRFWLSPSQAVGYVLEALKQESGQIYIPKMPSLSIGELAEYTCLPNGMLFDPIPLRPGEKVHETLMTIEEGHYVARMDDDCFVLNPTTSNRNDDGLPPYWSSKAPRLTKEELQELLNDD